MARGASDAGTRPTPMPRSPVDKDYYAILGVARTASEEEIRKAYRRLALAWHPDRRPGDSGAADRFKEISEAYAVLVNGARRREYDDASRAGASSTFHHRQEDLLRDLFRDPAASAVFADLAREFQRMGMRVDGQFFRHTLLDGRTVVVGGVFVVSPLAVIPTLARVARAMLRAGQPPAPAPGPASRPLPEAGRGLLASIGRAARRMLGGGSGPSRPGARPAEDVTVPLRLTPREAADGAERRVTLDGARGPEAVQVTIPPGTRAGMRLRLRGKGRPRTDGSRGDAYLAVEIAED
jgi:curved DNA-binding protein CbpA